MTELTPLAESAGASIALVLLGIPTAWRSRGFKQVLTRQLRMAVMLAIHVILVIVGIGLGIGAWVGAALAHGGYVLVEMWSARAAMPFWNGWNQLTAYCDKRRFYRAAHAA